MVAQESRVLFEGLCKGCGFGGDGGAGMTVGYSGFKEIVGFKVSTHEV